VQASYTSGDEDLAAPTTHLLPLLLLLLPLPLPPPLLPWLPPLL
jgi:hypothetical protein